MIVCGVDLSGPTNRADTAVACFEIDGDRAVPLRASLGVGDEALLGLLKELHEQDPHLVVGLDAPLSYNPGGGDRPADRDLRQVLRKAGLHSGTIMPPTMTRMVYLTVRGISVARLLGTLTPAPAIIEVHPGGVLVLHGAAAADVRALKSETAARHRLMAWLAEQNLPPALATDDPGDHMIAAHAAALGAWRWALGRSVWIAPATPPLHPFDLAC